MKNKKINIIFFDFDGTIADTINKAIEIYNQLAIKNNFNRVDEYNLPELRNNKPLEILRKLKIPLRKLPFVANKIRKKIEFHPKISKLEKGHHIFLKKIKTA